MKPFQQSLFIFPFMKENEPFSRKPLGLGKRKRLFPVQDTEPAGRLFPVRAQFRNGLDTCQGQQVTDPVCTHAVDGGGIIRTPYQPLVPCGILPFQPDDRNLEPGGNLCKCPVQPDGERVGGIDQQRDFFLTAELFHLFFLHTSGEPDGVDGIDRLFASDRRVVVGLARTLDDLYGLAAFGCSS